jgi:hypothetical protein
LWNCSFLKVYSKELGLRVAISTTLGLLKLREALTSNVSLEVLDVIEMIFYPQRSLSVFRAPSPDERLENSVWIGEMNDVPPTEAVGMALLTVSEIPNYKRSSRTMTMTG